MQPPPLRSVYNERDMRNTSVNVFFLTFYSKKEKKRKKHWKYDLLLSWIICMVNCIGVRTDRYVNKHIFIIYCTLVFTLGVCCPVFPNFAEGYMCVMYIL